MGRKILITSGKGGVGKTTITAGLGRVLAKHGMSVVLIDGDVGLNNLDATMDIEYKVEYDLNDYLCGRCRLRQCLVEDDKQKNLYTLPTIRESEKTRYLENFSDLTDKLAHVFDYCLIDCPAGKEANFKMMLDGASEAIVVVTPHLSAIRDAGKILSILDGNGISLAGIVINRIRGDLVMSSKMLSRENIAGLLGRHILGTIPESDALNIYSSLDLAEIVNKDVYIAIEYLARNLNDGENYEFDYMAKYRGVFGSIRRKLKEKF